MKGVPDRPTPINLANHNYYNLGGGGTVKDHVAVGRRLGLHADAART